MVAVPALMPETTPLLLTVAMSQPGQMPRLEERVKLIPADLPVAVGVRWWVLLPYLL